jgi:hypothetical protein
MSRPVDIGENAALNPKVSVKCIRLSLDHFTHIITNKLQNTNNERTSGCVFFPLSEYFLEIGLGVTGGVLLVVIIIGTLLYR